MEQIKLFDSEFRLMEIVWEHPDITAKEISLIAAKQIGWNKNTTYTILKKLVQKKAIKRIEPNFICNASISREQVATDETNNLISKLFRGSKKAFFASFASGEKLTEDEVKELQRIIDESRK